MESDLDRKYCCHGAGDWGGWERRGNDAKVKECSAAHLQGSESWKKAPFESDKKVGENRKYFVRNISRLSQTRKKKTLPQHSLPARNTLEIKKKKILIWLKRAEEPLLRDWQWRSSDTEALPWMWVRLDATRFPVLPKWLENIQNYIVWLQIWALPAHKVCSSSSNLFGIQTLTVYAACQTSLCPLFPHLDAIFLYGRSPTHDLVWTFVWHSENLESSKNKKNPPGRWFQHWSNQ